MKTVGKILAISLLLGIAGFNTLNAQRGIRTDSTRMFMRRGMDVRSDSLRRNFSRQDAPMRMMPGMRMQRQIPGYGMRRNFVPGPMYGMRQGRMPMLMERRGRDSVWMDRPFYGRIPNLTEKQRSDISDLRQKQQDEMNKLREENAEEMKAMREFHRDKLMEILTDEQKQWMEETRP